MILSVSVPPSPPTHTHTHTHTKDCLQDIANSDTHSSSCEESDFRGSDTDSDDEL